MPEWIIGIAESLPGNLVAVFAIYVGWQISISQDELVRDLVARCIDGDDEGSDIVD